MKAQNVSNLCKFYRLYADGPYFDNIIGACSDLLYLFSEISSDSQGNKSPFLRGTYFLENF